MIISHCFCQTFVTFQPHVEEKLLHLKSKQQQQQQLALRFLALVLAAASAAS